LSLFEAGQFIGTNSHPLIQSLREKVGEKEDEISELIGAKLLELLNGQ